MVIESPHFLSAALSVCLSVTALLPLTTQASDQTADSHNKSITVYFTRHAEKKTTTTTLGLATRLYQVTNPDNDPLGSEPNADQQPLGRNLDEVCGESQCAEELSDQGLLRANLLASWFLQRRVVGTLDAVYTSHKYRTYQTVLPTATLADLDIVQLPHGATELDPESTTPSVCATIDAIRDTPPGDTILIAGHSGTLYDMMGDGNDDCTGLGLLTDNEPGSHRFPKDEDGKARDYGDVWKVVIRNDSARFIYRVNLEATQLTIIDRAR